TTAAAGGLSRLGGAAGAAATGLKALGRATIIIGLLQVAMELIFNFAGSMEFLGDVLSNMGGWLSQSAQAFGDFANVILGAISVIAPPLSLLSSLFGGFGLGNVGSALSGMGKSLHDWGSSMKGAKDSLGDLDA